MIYASCHQISSVRKVIKHIIPYPKYQKTDFAIEIYYNAYSNALQGKSLWAKAIDKSLYSDESVAALEKAVNSVDKTLTADKQSTVDITVSLPEGTVTVTNAAILGADTLAYGNSTRLTLGTNDGANSYSVKWSSSDPSVAAVDANGNVTAKGRGSVTIKAEITNLDGTTVTAEKKLTCTMTFWQRVVAFFKGLFGKTKNIYFA